MSFKTIKKIAISTKLVLAMMLLAVGNVADAARPIDRAVWEEATRDLSYSEKPPKPRPEKKTPKQTSAPIATPPSFGKGWGVFFQILFVAVIFGLLVGVLYLVFQQNANRNKHFSNENVNLRNIEEHLERANIDKFLQEALQQLDFKLAIRLYYLRTVQLLAEKRWIIWKKEKTNGDYVSELQTTDWFSDFSNLTVIFDKIWYGDLAVSYENFKVIEPNFAQFIQKLQQLPSKTF